MKPETAARILRLRRQNGYSVQGIAARVGVTRATVSRVLKGDISPLEARTTRKYLKCQERGGCIPSKVYVVRLFQMGHMAIPECKRCKVLIRAKGRGMQWNYFDTTKPAENPKAAA